MPMDLRPYSNALSRLKEGLLRYQADETDEQIRDGLIQRFEFTYELSHKTLKRYLKSVSPSPEAIDALTFQDLIRSGKDHGLLSQDWKTWKTFRELKGKTSHLYDEAQARLVVAQIPGFIQEAQFLHDQLKDRLP